MMTFVDWFCRRKLGRSDEATRWIELVAVLCLYVVPGAAFRFRSPFLLVVLGLVAVDVLALSIREARATDRRVSLVLGDILTGRGRWQRSRKDAWWRFLSLAITLMALIALQLFSKPSAGDLIAVTGIGLIAVSELLGLVHSAPPPPVSETVPGARG